MLFCLTAISSGAFCDKHSDRHTMLIYGQVCLGVASPICWLWADRPLSYLRHKNALYGLHLSSL